MYFTSVIWPLKVLLKACMIQIGQKHEIFLQLNNNLFKYCAGIHVQAPFIYFTLCALYINNGHHGIVVILSQSFLIMI